MNNTDSVAVLRESHETVAAWLDLLAMAPDSGAPLTPGEKHNLRLAARLLRAALNPAPPGSDAVTEEIAADVLHRFNATAPSGDHWPPERCRELRIKAMQQAITNAALAARTGKGGANER